MECEGCFREESDDDVFRKCKKCGMTVHESCYNIKDNFENFFCHFCQFKKKNEQRHCVLCDNQNRAVVLTSESNFVHVTCALFTPEAYFEDHEKMIANIKKVPKSRFNKNICCVCNKKNGVTVKCSEKRCKKFCHVLCLSSNCESYVIRETKIKNKLETQFLLFCKDHTTPKVIIIKIKLILFFYLHFCLVMLILTF